MASRQWTVTVSWESTGTDLDLYTTLSVGGQTSSGVGWNNGGQTESIRVNSGGVNGVFYLCWNGDNTSAGGSETLTVYFSGTLPTGSTQVATVTPHCNYFGSGSGAATITVNGQSGSYTVSSPSTRYRSRADAGDPSVSVPLFANGGSPSSASIITVTLNANGGSVSPSEVYYLNPSGSTRYGSLPTPTPPQGEGFEGWYTALSGGSRIDANTTLASTSNHTIYARYIHYAIHTNAYPSTGGTVSGGGFYALGATCTLTATPNQYYGFVKWTRGLSGRDEYVSSNPTYSFTVTQDDVYNAYFERNAYLITTNVGTSEGGTVSGGGTYSPNATATLTATPDTSYVVDYWKKNGAIIAGSVGQTSLSITVTADATYTVYFRKKGLPPPVIVTISTSVSGVGGTSEVTDGTSIGTSIVVTSGTPYTVTAKPSPGYQFDHWEIVVQQQSSTETRNPWSGYASTGDVSFVAYFIVLQGAGQLIYDDATGRLICADSGGELIYHDRVIELASSST